MGILFILWFYDFALRNWEVNVDVSAGEVCCFDVAVELGDEGADKLPAKRSARL